MNGWNFPILFDKNEVSILQDEEAVLKDLRLLLRTELHSFFQDPGYGSPFLSLQFRAKNKLTEDLMADALVQTSMFIPNVRIDKNAISFLYKEAGSVDIEFEAIIDNRILPVTLRLEEVQ